MTKEQRIERRTNKVNSWLTIFRREYEMCRAYRNNKEVSIRRANGEAMKAINSDLMCCAPSDRSFFIDCKVEYKCAVPKIVDEEEFSLPQRESCV